MGGIGCRCLGFRPIVMRVLNRVSELGVGRAVMLPLLLLFCSCSSMNLPPLPSFPSPSSAKPKNYPIFKVMTQGAPFYLKHSPDGIGGSKAYPFLYLDKGATVSLLESGKRYSKVSLINGMKGWMPVMALAPQMTTGLGSSPGMAPMPVEPAPSDDHSKPATRFNPGAGLNLPSY